MLFNNVKENRSAVLRPKTQLGVLLKNDKIPVLVSRSTPKSSGLVETMMNPLTLILDLTIKVLKLLAKTRINNLDPAVLKWYFLFYWYINLLSFSCQKISDFYFNEILGLRRWWRDFCRRRSVRSLGWSYLPSQELHGNLHRKMRWFKGCSCWC